MSLLILGQVAPEAVICDFGPELAAHLQAKTHPEARRASCAAWQLLAQGLQHLDVRRLPQVQFDANGKPHFMDSTLHFSLSHSGGMAAALISEAPCGVDLECIRPEVAQRLRDRCLHPDEVDQDFFQIWTRKECIAKLDGRGLPGQPRRISTLDGRWQNQFYSARIEANGRAYMLSALCADAASLKIIKTDPWR